MEKNEFAVKQFIVGLLKNKLNRSGISFEKLDFDENFLKSGFIDSMTFLELLTALETHFSIAIDFSGLDPAEFTTLNGLIYYSAKLIHEQGSDPVRLR